VLSKVPENDNNCRKYINVAQLMLGKELYYFM
jgi:hypothetical protein